MKKLIIIVVGLYISLVAITQGIAKYSSYSDLKKQSAEIEKHFPAMLKDLNLLRDQDLFPVQDRLKNADTQLVKELAGISAEEKGLFSELIKEHFSVPMNQKSLTNLQDDPKLQQVYTEWLGLFGSYDYLDLSERKEFQNTIKEAAELGDVERVAKLKTLPDYSAACEEVLKIAPIHVIKRETSGRGDEALADVRKLAELFHSSGTIAGSKCAVSLLKIEREMMVLLSILNYKTIPDATAKAYKRVVDAWGGVLFVAWFQNMPADFQPFIRAQFGICGASKELFKTTPTSFYNYLVPTVYFESKYTEIEQRSQKLLSDIVRMCEANAYSPVLKPAGEQKQSFMSQKGFYIRRLLGLGYLKDSISDWMKPYKE